MNDLISTKQVHVEERVRKDMGNIDELCNSIKEVGLIQPIVLTHDYRLVAGERRLKALLQIGVTELIHAKHFIFNDEQDDVRLKAIECEENLKRKAFTWQEEILAKKRLLELMQQIHGVARPGYPARSDTLGITSPGFGINKLSSLLGESNAQTSKDIELARLIEAVPQLARAETKEAARRQAVLATSVAIALAQNIANPPKTDQKWTLYEGDFEANSQNVPNGSIDLVLCDPPYGNATQGMAANSKLMLANPFEDGIKSTKEVLRNLAMTSYGVLKQNTFAAFFFDFVLYDFLWKELTLFGFSVDIIPIIWVKNNVINTDPYTRYGRSYEPLLIAKKGSPKLMRPSQRDVIINIDSVMTRSANEQKLYQAQKPRALMEKLIIDLCVPGGTVLDFCAGSGTTGEAALRLSRRAVLFERDPIACQIIRARLGAL